MMAKLINKCVLIGRTSVILATLLALIISGAEAASRLFSAYQSAEQEDNYVFDQVDLSPSPEEATGEMATTGQPNAEPVGYIQSPLCLQGVGLGSHTIPSGKAHAASNCVSFSDESNSTLCSSPCQVSSSLGRRLTLVGAKPSGKG